MFFACFFVFLIVCRHLSLCQHVNRNVIHICSLMHIPLLTSVKICISAFTCELEIKCVICMIFVFLLSLCIPPFILFYSNECYFVSFSILMLLTFDLFSIVLFRVLSYIAIHCCWQQSNFPMMINKKVLSLQLWNVGSQSHYWMALWDAPVPMETTPLIRPVASCVRRDMNCSGQQRSGVTPQGSGMTKSRSVKVCPVFVLCTHTHVYLLQSTMCALP